MLWLHIHFYQLTLDNLPSEQKRASVVVYDASKNSIVQTSDLAQQAGIENGMGLAQAASLCGNLKVIDYQKQIEVEHLKNLASLIYQCAAEVALCPPAALFIRLDNLTRYYGNLQSIWLTIKSVLQERHLHFQFATANSPEAAAALARAGTNTLLFDKILMVSALGQLPVSVLSLPPKSLHALSRAGIKQVVQLLNIPPTELGKRFDDDTLKYVFALRGERHHRLVFYHPPAEFKQTINLPYEEENTQRLLPFIGNALQELAVFLRLRNAGVLRLNLSLSYREHAPSVLKIGKADSHFCQKEWLELIALKLDKLMIPAPVITMVLHAAELCENDSVNNDLFNNRTGVFAKQQLIGKLSARLGESQVSKPMWPKDHRLQVLSDTAHSSESALKTDVPGIVLAVPEQLNESPVIEFGPVRVETGWWDKNKYKRDYYIAKNKNGQRMQIFKEANRWFVSGWYI